MRLLEIGAGNCPSTMQFDSEVEYFGVDRTGANAPEQNLFNCSIEEFSQSCPDSLRFDYVFGANVLGSLLSAGERFSVIRAAGKLICDGGEVVFIEYLTPERAELWSLRELVMGRVIFDASPEFDTEWQKHRPITPSEMKSRLNLRVPFQMLVNTR